MTQDLEITKRFAKALTNYQAVLDEQGKMFATRDPRDLGEADAEVRAALKALIDDLD
ncbi:hypothetical protein [Agromyces mariniharenae]|uniref:hypothetical protein n=1 Tax=Agromyces mariniharenae TaxID=2604423 RepID=UPI001652C1CA|nr:hypothetical protein [Agromyces mariniharenae]